MPHPPADTSVNLDASVTGAYHSYVAVNASKYRLLFLLACVLTHCSTSAPSRSRALGTQVTGTSSEARRTHAGWKRRAGARATVRPRQPSCPAARSCPVRLARRGLPTTSSFAAPSEHNSDEPGGSSRTQRTEAVSRGASDGASASSLVPCCLPLPSSTSPAAPSVPVLLPVRPRALGTQQRRARRLVAHTEDGGEEQVHEGLCVRIVPRALLSAPALLDSPSAASRSLLFSRSRSTTARLGAVLAGATLRMHPRSTDASVQGWVILQMHPSN